MRDRHLPGTGFFVGRGGHVWLITLSCFVCHLPRYIARFFARIAPLVLQSREPDNRASLLVLRRKFRFVKSVRASK